MSRQVTLHSNLSRNKPQLLAQPSLDTWLGKSWQLCHGSKTFCPPPQLGTNPWIPLVSLEPVWVLLEEHPLHHPKVLTGLFRAQQMRLVSGLGSGKLTVFFPDRSFGMASCPSGVSRDIDPGWRESWYARASPCSSWGSPRSPSGKKNDLRPSQSHAIWTLPFPRSIQANTSWG